MTSLLAGWGAAWIGDGHGTAALIGLVVAPWAQLGGGLGVIAVLPVGAAIGIGLQNPKRGLRVAAFSLLCVHWIAVGLLLHVDRDRGRGLFSLLEERGENADPGVWHWLIAFSVWELWRLGIAVLNLWLRRNPPQDGVPTWERHHFPGVALGVVAIEAVFLVIVCWINRGWVFRGVFASP